MQRMTRTDGVAWVTGASSGIGRALALELARRGWTVAASARRQSMLVDLSVEAGDLPGRIIAHAVDVTDSADQADVIDTIESFHGPIVLALFNAGVSPHERDLMLDAASFDEAFGVNLLGVVHGLSPVLERMKLRGHGQVAVNASLAGYGGLPKAAAYGASKAALIHLCETLKLPCDKAGIMLQVINHGFVDTPLMERGQFPMPYMIRADMAARRIVDGLERSGFEIAFPQPLAWAMKAARLLPYPLYFYLLSRLRDKLTKPA